MRGCGGGGGGVGVSTDQGGRRCWLGRSGVGVGLCAWEMGRRDETCETRWEGTRRDERGGLRNRSAG